MEKDVAAKAVDKKIAPVTSEQGAAKEAGSKPPENFGHGSVKSAGTAGQIPGEV